MNIPKFGDVNDRDDRDDNDARIKFVRFIKKNQDIFDELLTSGKYMLTRDTTYILDGYSFFKDFDLSDDANIYSLKYNLDDFNTEGEPKIQIIINEFDTWLERDKVKEYFEKEYKKKIKKLNREPLNQIEEIGVKRRTMKRTSKIKKELSTIDYVPEDKEKSVKGKEYRRARDKFYSQKGGMKRKTKKTRKNRRRKGVNITLSKEK